MLHCRLSLPMKTCSFSFLEETVDSLPLIILLRKWSCNLMVGESHRLSGGKRNYSVVSMDWILLRVCIFVCHITVEASGPTLSETKGYRVDLQLWLFWRVLGGFLSPWGWGEGRIDLQRIFWFSYWLCQYVWVFKVALGSFLFPGKERACTSPQFPGKQKPLCN